MHGPLLPPTMALLYPSFSHHTEPPSFRHLYLSLSSSHSHPPPLSLFPKLPSFVAQPFAPSSDPFIAFGSSPRIDAVSLIQQDVSDEDREALVFDANVSEAAAFIGGDGTLDGDKEPVFGDIRREWNVPTRSKETYLSDTRVNKTTRSSNFWNAVGTSSSGRLPINLDLDIYRARMLFRRREIKKAEQILRQCIKDWPADGRAYVLLGTRLMKQGRFVDARAVLEDGCQAARGENPYIWQAWAILEEKLGHLSEARKLFDAATAADIKHAAAWHGWASLELRQGSIQKARELLSKGIKYCGGNEYLYQTSALIEYKAGNVEAARALFSQAVYYNPKSCASWLAWALLESEEGNNSTARHLFQKGIQASPKNRYAWQAWAIFESNQGNNDWARRLFQEGVDLNPDDVVLLQAFALFEYGSSNPDLARDLFKRASSADPKHQPVWNAWGWMEWKEGNLDFAREYYKQSLSINSRSMEAARTFHAWAILEEGDGNYGAARLLLKCALRVDSQNTFAWKTWEKLEQNLGNNDRAEEIRMQYLQQRTEVVDDIPWEVSFSNVFAPAINRIKKILGIGSQPVGEDEKPIDLPKEIVEVMNKRQLDLKNVNDVDFDLEAFIEKVLPWKYSKHELKSRPTRKEGSRSFIVTNVTN